MPPKASTSTIPADPAEVEQDEELPEDEEEAPAPAAAAATVRKSRVLKKPNERKRFRGTGWRIIFYSKALRRVKDTRVNPNGKITGTAARQADIGAVAKSVRFDSDGNWMLQAYQETIAGRAQNPNNSVVNSGQVVPNSTGYQSWTVRAA